MTPFRSDTVVGIIIIDREYIAHAAGMTIRNSRNSIFAPCKGFRSDLGFRPLSHENLFYENLQQQRGGGATCRNSGLKECLDGG